MTAEERLPHLYAGSIEHYPPPYLACRSLDGRHAWTAHPHWEVTTGHGGQVIEYHRLLACERCHGVDRVDHFDADMRRTRSSTMRYRPGYLAAKGNAEELSAAAARLEQFRRETRGGRLRVVAHAG